MKKMEDINITWILTLTTLGWVMALLFLVGYLHKPTEIIQQIDECKENYNLQEVEKAGRLCSEQGGVLTNYRIGSYTDTIYVSISCDFIQSGKEQK